MVEHERRNKTGTVGAVIVAAGSSRRMEGVDKLFEPLDGHPLIWYSLDTVMRCRYVDRLVLVLSSENLDAGQALIDECGWAVDVCGGGVRRQDSVLNGLHILEKCEWVLIHDGARPFLDEIMIVRGLDAARETGAAVAAVPATDTIKLSDEYQTVIETMPRDRLWVVQTPQIFKWDLLTKAHSCISEDVTDDAGMVELIGGKIKLFHGSYGNIKVTTPEDLLIASTLLEALVPLQRSNAP